MRKALGTMTVLIGMSMLVHSALAPLTVGKTKVTAVWYGMSSWYGDDWAGKKTACGQRFDPNRLTAAHPYLACGTWLRITNVRTGHSEFARVTDRGPYEEGREIDVSARVARKIDLKKFGVEKVKIEVVESVVR